MTSSNTWAQIVSKITSVVNRGTYIATITTSGGSINIPAGYHNGNGKISASSSLKLPVTIGTFAVSTYAMTVPKAYTTMVVSIDSVSTNNNNFKLSGNYVYIQGIVGKVSVSFDGVFSNPYGNVTHYWTIYLYKNGGNVGSHSFTCTNTPVVSSSWNFGAIVCNPGDYFHLVVGGNSNSYSAGTFGSGTLTFTITS